MEFQEGGMSKFEKKTRIFKGVNAKKKMGKFQWGHDKIDWGRLTSKK